MIQNSDIPQAIISARYSTSDRGIDNPDWEKAQGISITHDWSGNAAPPHKHARSQLLWAENSLKVRFVCRQSGPPLVNANPQFETKTLRLWDKDVCEIFLAPNPEQPERYFEFEAAPTGEWVDLGIQLTPAGRQTDWDFQSGMSVEATTAPDEIIVCMQIPWSDSIPKPRRGESWRLNLFRCVGTGDERFLAWRPTYAPEPNFHVPAVFGWLRFD